jgi:uncharacterized protein DUF5678
MANEILRKNWEYVKKNFQSLLNSYRNKYILVYKEHVVGSFDTYATAANEGLDSYGAHSGFLVQYITEKEPLNIVVSAKL